MSVELDNIQKISLALIWEFIIKARKLKKTDFNQSLRSSWSPEQYSNELCCFKLSFPRRWGNTTLALELLMRYKAVYACPTPELETIAKEKVPPRFRKKIFTTGELLWMAEGKKISKRTELIVTDCSEYIPEGTLPKLYSLLSYIDPLYIHLG
jgi:hypothetical protein